MRCREAKFCSQGWADASAIAEVLFQKLPHKVHLEFEFTARPQFFCSLSLT